MEPFARLKRVKLASFLAGSSLLVLASACSPTSLFSSKPAELPAPQYHPINTACANLDLKSPKMNGHELRAILKCFNAYGALDPMKRLFDHLTDAQVQAFVDVGNRYLIGDHSFLYEAEKSYFDEKSSGALDASMKSIGSLFEHPDLVASAMSMMNPGQDKQLTQDLLGVLRTMGEHMNADSVAQALSIGMNVGSSRAFYSLQKNDLMPDTGSRDAVAPYDLSALANSAIRYLNDSQAPGSFSFLDAVNRAYKSGDLPIALDTLFGMNSNEVAGDVPSLSPIFPVLSANDGDILNALGELTRSLSGPIECLRGKESDPTPILDLMQDIASQPDGQAGKFLARPKLLTLTILEPFCDYPDALKNDYSKLVALADSDAMYGSERTVKAAWRLQNADGSRPLIRLILGFLGDPKTPELLPLFEDLSAKKAWSDLLLLFSMPSNADRDRIFSGLSVLADPAPELGGRSASDALTDLMVHAGPEPLVGFANAAKTYVKQEPSFLYPMLGGLRAAYYANDAHPFVNLAAQLMKDVNAKDKPENAIFFQTLFSMTKYPEFKQSLALLSAMGKDGRMKELWGATVALLHGFAQQAPHRIEASSRLPLFSATRRHNLAASDLDGVSIPRSAVSSSCLDLTLATALDDVTDPSAMSHEWDQFSACLSSVSGYGDLSNEINYLRDEKTETGQDDLTFAIGLVHDFGKDLNPDEIGYLADSWANGEDDGSFNQELATVARFIQDQVVRPLFDLAGPLLKGAKSSLDQLEQFVAGVLKRDDFPDMATEADHVAQLAQTSAPDPVPSMAPNIPPLENDLPRVERWIHNKECENFASGDDAAVQARAQQVLQGYSDGVSSFLEDGGGPKLSFSLDEVKSSIEPVLQRITDPGQSLPNHTILDGILGFFADYDLQPGQAPTPAQHFTPADLEKWFYDRATDRKLITQYYITDAGAPADPHPDVRYVDSLDRLELLILNADFDVEVPFLTKLGIPAGMNLGKLALQEIGNSWGDEPQNLWPPEIQQKYAGSKPPTLKETIDHLASIMQWMKVAVGFPKLPECSQQVDPNDPPQVQQQELSNNEPVCDPLPRLSLVPPLPDFPNLPGCMNLPDMKEFGLNQIKRRIYNVAQVFSVLEENLPNSGTPEAGGLKLLRDLFYELNYSTPEQYRGQLDDDRNNLSLITVLMRSGLLHEVAFELRRFAPDSPVLQDAFSAVASFGKAPAAPKLLHQILVDDSTHQLIWKMAQSIYPLLGSPIPLGQPARIDALQAKQSVDYGLADLGQLALTAPALDAVTAVLSEHSDYVLRHADLAADLSEPILSRALRIFHDDPNGAGKQGIAQVLGNALEEPEFVSNLVGMAQLIEDNPATQNAIQTFMDRLKKFNSGDAATGGFQLRELEKMGRGLLNFFEAPEDGSIEGETSHAIRLYVADRLDSGSRLSSSDMDEILLLISHDPNRFEDLVDLFPKYTQDGELEGFLSYVRDEMKPVQAFR